MTLKRQDSIQLVDSTTTVLSVIVAYIGQVSMTPSYVSDVLLSYQWITYSYQSNLA